MLCTLPSFLYWEVCEPVQSHIVACLHNHDNIFILPAFTFRLCIFNYRMPTGTVKKPFFHVPVVPELWQKSLTRLHDHFIKYHKHRRQYKDNHNHTDDRTSRHQDTQGTDHINVGVKSYTCLLYTSPSPRD